MKKLINTLFVTFGLLASVSTFAQNSSDDTELTVNIGESYSIEVNQATVAIDMNLPSHFTGGNESGVQDNHVKVTASGAYYVEAKTSGATFNGPSGTSTLDVSNVELVLTDGGDLSGNQSTLSNINSQATNLALSVTEQEVVNVDGGDLNRGFDVNYLIPAANASNFLNQANGNYTTTVTYTIVPN
ncbi:hypothetical protein [Mesonia maritima]|uniref:WxL domain-containing protein n=2 Tax=Mesonia maritima TaxID=1793873 RepID=A0ABU1K4G4_9FLAO|nr:hypothetical protein [Mesonia maritima]MDR6300483.1 hypothetical protein [Mesonia maritima]